MPRRTPPSSAALSISAVITCVLIATACSTGSPASSSGSDANDPTPRVTRVVDGDTVVVRMDGHDERVRLIGVDTPETKDPRKPVQCFGKEASGFTSNLLPKGTRVRLERDVEERDRYDRLLAYLYRVDDGLFVNRELVAQGYAATLTIPPNVAHADEFAALAAQARDAGLGLWGACGGPGVPAG